MDFQLDQALPVLRATPLALRHLLQSLPDEWTLADEGPDTWSPFDVVGHLIHGDRTDWVPRVEHILKHGDRVTFPPFDRFAMLRESDGRELGDLLKTFEQVRAESLDRLDGLELTEADLSRKGHHPDLGRVTLRQHLATWVTHDLGHMAQIARVMARQYSEAVGPWRAYLSILSAS